MLDLNGNNDTNEKKTQSTMYRVVLGLVSEMSLRASGINPPGFASAAWDSMWRTFDGRGPRGASTLTMQLAGLLDPGLAISGNARTIGQKWDQAQARSYHAL